MHFLVRHCLVIDWKNKAQSLPRTQTSLSLSEKMCAQRKAGRRQRASPAVCTLPMDTCGSSPVAPSTLRKTKRLRRRLAHYVVIMHFKHCLNVVYRDNV